MTLEEMRKHEWVVSWSGGKDSTATIILMKEHNIPIKKIVYVQMMYDNDTPATLPVMYSYVNKAIKVFKDMWGLNVEIVRPKTTACDLMNKKYFRSKYPEKNGSLYGISVFSRRGCWLQGVKRDTIKANTDSNDYHMIGYAYDEPERLKRLEDKQASILETLLVAENDCYELCKRHGLLSPLYGLGFMRDGCWFCPNAGNAQRNYIKRRFPALYNKIIESIKMCSYDVVNSKLLNNWLDDYKYERRKYGEK